MTMLKRYKEWFQTLTPKKQLTVYFIVGWCYCFVAWVFGERFLFNEERSWNYHILHATFMACFMTVAFKWAQLKAIMKGKDKQRGASESEKRSK